MDFFCPICQSKEFDYKITCTDFTVSKEQFNIVSCKECNFYITYPCPDEKEISKYYESENYIPHSDKKTTIFDKIYHLVRNYMVKYKTNLIKKYVPHGTILDFGCGTGYFMEECKKIGFNTIGIEPSKIARETCEKKKLKVFKDIEEFLRVDIKVDITSLWHVLEHIHNSKALLLTLHNLLKDGGILVLALPNRNSFDAKYYKSFWAGYDVPRHIYHFTKKDVENITKDKYRLLEIYPLYFDSFYVSMLSEKYKRNKFYLFKGTSVGLISNFKAITNKEFSSLIYVLQKI